MLPEEPNLHMLTTNISTDAIAVFGKQGLLIQHRNNLGQPTFELIPGTMASMAQVVGASSAFPGLFPPVKITATDIGVREGFSFLPVSERIDPNEDPTALHPVVQTEVRSIRTDLDAFSDIEINA